MESANTIKNQKIESILKINHPLLSKNANSVYYNNFTAIKMSNKYQKMYVSAIKTINL